MGGNSKRYFILQGFMQEGKKSVNLVPAPFHNHPLLSIARLPMIGPGEDGRAKDCPLPKGAGMKPLDTAQEAEKIQLDIFRRMGPERRLQAGLALMRTCRELLREGVRRRHPEYDERQIGLAVIRLTLPDDLFFAAYPEAREILP